MNEKMPSQETVARLREKYPEGTRVELISMEDPHTTLQPGDKGRVSLVDDTGTIFVDWENGSGLGVVYGVDSVKRIENERHYDTGADFWKDTAANYGIDEAAGICGRYLSMQIKTDSPEERQFCRELFVAMMEDIIPHTDPAKLVYPYSFEKANERLEVSFFSEGRDRNAYCAQAIDSEINASCFETHRYNLELAAMSVTQEYGFSRVIAVLAHNLQRHEHDGRYSRDNKEWAAGQTLPDGAFDYAHLNAHPILVEDFTKYVRKLYEELGAERFALPGREESGETIHGYEVIRSIAFDDQRGFAIGHNPSAAEPFVSWQFTVENGNSEYYWGRYSSDLAGAGDSFTARTLIHMQDARAQEIGSPIAAVEMSTEQNYNMIDGQRNNMAHEKADLTDGQTHAELQELAPETLPTQKPSVLEQIREARKNPAPSLPKAELDRGTLELEL